MIKLLGWLFVAGKLGKLLGTGGTMLLSMLAYTLIFGWQYAVGFVLLIFIHELGHYAAARQRGLAVSGITFLPFVGAWTALEQLPHDAETSAWVGFGGPIAGTLAAMGCYFLGRHFDSHLLLALAYSGCMLNLLNLIPIKPLDGGHITAVISPKVWLVGAPLLVALFFYRPSPMLLLIAILAYPQLKLAIWGDPTLPETYYQASVDTRMNYAAIYIGLCAFLGIMSFEIHDMLKASGAG